jgi:zinc transporter ZupT
VALVIHKAVVGFSLGVRLVQSKLRPFSIVLCCIVFSIQVLIGGFLAMLVSSIVHSQSVGATAMVSGVLQVILMEYYKFYV